MNPTATATRYIVTVDPHHYDGARYFTVTVWSHALDQDISVERYRDELVAETRGAVLRYLIAADAVIYDRPTLSQDVSELCDTITARNGLCNDGVPLTAPDYRHGNCGRACRDLQQAHAAFLGHS